MRKRKINRRGRRARLKRRSSTRRLRLPRNMPAKYRRMLTLALATTEGRRALARYRKFSGLPWPTEILAIHSPGTRQRRTLVGLGRTPQLVIAKRRGDRPIRIRRNGIVTTNASGKRIIVLSGVDSHERNPRLQFVGFAAETHYHPTRAQEQAGTSKAGKYWVHKHDEGGGRWPRVYVDQAGNYVYGPGTYRVSNWIRR
jgi:hypothetical protein